MEAYTDFAYVYDVFMDNTPYDKWGGLLVSRLEKEGITDGILLDLGCGTGNMTELLSEKGYDMIGVDYSGEMLNVAMDKRARSGRQILYLQQDIREFELYGTVRAVVCVCDSLNYLLEEEEIENIQRKLKEKLSGDASAREVRERGKGKSILLAILLLVGAVLGVWVWKSPIMAIVLPLLLFGMYFGLSYLLSQKRKREQQAAKKAKTEERRRLLKESLQERQMKLENLKEEAAERKHDYDTIEKIRKEIQAVSIAGAKIKEAAGNLQKLTGHKLQDEISEIFAQITGGKYKRVLLTENFEIYLDTGEKYLQLYQVSYGTAEQVYLALRLACGTILCQEEELPLILDETFAMYDEKRLIQALKYISQRKSQVILFSSNKREIQALEKAGIPFSLSKLS